MGRGVKIFLIAVIGLLGLAISACGSDSEPAPTSTAVPSISASPTPSPEPQMEPNEVTAGIVNFAHKDLTVAVGTTVRWVNQAISPHTTKAGIPPDQPSGEWDSLRIQPGDDFAFTFDEVGEFPYFCNIHKSMTATITVVAEGSSLLDSTPVSGSESQSSTSIYGY